MKRSRCVLAYSINVVTVTMGSNNNNNNNNNRLALQQASDIQQDTLSAVRRIQLQASETESVGITTLEELQLQREKLDGILKEGDRLHGQLDTAERLQNRFGLWSMSLSSRRGAAKDAKKSIKEQKAKAKLDEERSLRISASMGSTTSTSASSYGSASSTSNKSEPVRVKHTSSLVKSRPKKNNKPTTCDDTTPKGLLYGIDAKGHENEGELNDLADADKIIDQELDTVSKQLEGLLGMSRAMGSEIRTQNAAMDEVETTLAKADYKSRVVNERGRRFLAGKPRAELDKKRVVTMELRWQGSHLECQALRFLSTEAAAR